MSETTESAVEPLAPAAPGQRSSRELAARIMSIVLLGWLCVIAVLAWMAFQEGSVGMLLPAWNSIFVLGMVPLVSGIFARRLWAQRWVVGISTFTALSHGIQAARMDSSLLWLGAAVLGAVALTVRSAKPVFSDSDGNRGRIQQTVAMIVTIGSVVVGLGVLQGGGTERGRAQFVTEVQQSYEQAGNATIRVYSDKLDLVIEAKTDSDAQIDGAADVMQQQLDSLGRRAKAWAVGFEHIVITNGSYRRVVAPQHAR